MRELMGKRSKGLNSSAMLARMASTSMKKAVYRRSDSAEGSGGGGAGAGVAGLFLSILKKIGLSTRGTG